MKPTRLIPCLFLLFCGTSARADYRVAGSIGQGQLGQISQLAIDADDRVCALENNGKITIFNGDGSVAATIETGLANTDAMAVAPDGRIHVLSTLTETKKVKSGARMKEIQIPIGVECGVFDPAGAPLKTIRLGNLKSAASAAIIGDKLVVADLTARAVVFMELETGKETGRITKGLRLCCGIFDLCEAPGNTLAVANLGAFKLQRFNLQGGLVAEFGQRGRGIDDFQGCCNPVSAGYLPDGRIVTVEKDPTRIKICDADGKNAKLIEGIDNLVAGCSFIPTAVDRKGNIYLGANLKGYIVKCTP